MNRSMQVAACIVLTVGSVLDAGQRRAPADLQTPTFKMQVDYVEVDAVVTDANGNFVRNLTPDDFQVFEDGKPQSISAFSIVDIPVERYERPLFASRPIEPDVKTNERPFDGRIYVLLVDDLHTAFGLTERARIAGRKFVEEHLGANDLMAVVHVGGSNDANQDFTNNKRLLTAAVEKTIGQKLDSPFEAKRQADALQTLDALRDLSDWLAGVRNRRKTIMFISEGIDYDLGLISNTFGSTVFERLREVVTAATRGNVSIFAVDPRGLSISADNVAEVGGVDQSTLGVGGVLFSRALLISQDSLRELADETGGFAAVNANDFSTAFDRIVRDNSTYYVLAYYPPTNKPGKVHDIDVRVNRSGLTVRARRAYLTPRPATTAVTNSGTRPLNRVLTPELSAAMDSPIPISGLAMQAFAVPFKGSAPNASVLIGIEMRGRDLGLAPNDRVVMSWVAVDRDSKIRGRNMASLTLNLGADLKSRVQQTGIRVLDRVDLPPGRYQLRVAAQNPGLGTLGSVVYDLEVPDFNKPALTMSGIVLTSAAGAIEPTLRPDQQLEQVLPGPPIGLRTFPSTDELALFVEAYDNEASKSHKVDITATVTTDEGRVMFKNNEVRESRELKGKRGGYGYLTHIPLKELARGSYVLTVSARSTLGDGSLVQRQLRFTVGG